MIVLTGAAGHIGNVLIRELLKIGKGPIRALVLPDEALFSLEGLDIEVVKGNILDPDSLDNAFQGADLVFHLASIVVISRGTEKLVEKVNVIFILKKKMLFMNALKHKRVRTYTRQ